MFHCCPPPHIGCPSPYAYAVPHGVLACAAGQQARSALLASKQGLHCWPASKVCTAGQQARSGLHCWPASKVSTRSRCSSRLYTQLLDNLVNGMALASTEALATNLHTLYLVRLACISRGSSDCVCTIHDGSGGGGKAIRGGAKQYWL
jgi:hypothetical protein